MRQTHSRSVLFRQLMIGLGLLALVPLLIVGAMVWLLGPSVLMPVLLTFIVTGAALTPMAARWMSEPVSRLIEQMVALTEGGFERIIPSVRSAEQRLALNAAISRRTAAIVLAPIDPFTTLDAVDQAAVAGMPVITADAHLAHEERVAAHVGADSYTAARQAAEELATLIDRRGAVALLVFSSLLPESLAREQGFRDGLSAFPEIEIVAVQSYDSDVRRARAAADQVLQRWPDLAAIYTIAESKEVDPVLSLWV